MKSGFRFWNPDRISDIAIEREIQKWISPPEDRFQLRNPNPDFMDFACSVRLGIRKRICKTILLNSGLLFANYASACKTAVLKDSFSNPLSDFQKQISQRWNLFSDFAFNFKSEIRILKSKSRFPTRRQREWQKNNRFNEQNNNFARAAHFFVIPLPFLHDSNVKMPNFGFCRERKQATTKFYLSFWTWISTLGIQSTSGGFAYILQSKWVGIIAIKTERTQNLLFKRHSGCRRGCWILKVSSILQMTSLILKNSKKFYPTLSGKIISFFFLKLTI